jgi:polyisoprenoid-binding protein YceI
LLLAACAVAQAAPTAADEIVFDLVPAQTEVRFTLTDVLHTVHGTFQLKNGTIRFDPATGNASGDVVVDVASGVSGSPARDRKMHKDVLQSVRYPEAVFTPDRVEGHIVPDGTADLQVHGLFKIHGTAHEITFQTQVQTKGHQFTATLHSEIPYVKWGMKNPSTLFLRVSDKVELDIHTTGHERSAGRPAGGTLALRVPGEDACQR